ncbi:MAG TPA: hypothetical protein VHY56_03880, partial [Candidatus Binataceae bacterium]|nr:hypothetical protein [Candidatus Binataceae bacterium]
MGATSQSVQSAGSWRPPQWSQPAQTSIYVPATMVTPASSVITDPNDPLFGTTLPSASGTIPAAVYVFDAILRAEHQRELRKTEHPVQTGANITDHAYLLPARITLEIG